MRGESGSPARCSCGLGTPSLSRLLAAVGADVQTQRSASHAGGAAVCHRRRRRSLGCAGSCSAVLSASVSPSQAEPICSVWVRSLQPSMGLEELQYPLRTNASTGMNGWVHVFHMFQLNLPVAAHLGCRVSQRVHTSGSFPRRAVGWHTQC